MHTDTLQRWACPRYGHYPLGLDIEQAEGDEICTGSLTCPQCGGVYEIRSGIPDFLVFEDDESAQLKRTELESRQHELEWPTELREVYEAQLEAEAVLARLCPTSEDHVLDAGCGFGRITCQILESGARVTAIDFSRTRLELLRQHTNRLDRVALAVADANHLPLQPNTFSKVISTQVLEHLPTPELRQAFLRKLFDSLVPGGELVLTVYNYDHSKQRRNYPREGYHDSGIFYHCYMPAELQTELSDFEVHEICGIRHYLKGSYKLKLFARLGRLGYAIDHAVEKIPALSLRYGSLLLAHAVKPD